MSQAQNLVQPSSPALHKLLASLPLTMMWLGTANRSNSGCMVVGCSHPDCVQAAAISPMCCPVAGSPMGLIGIRGYAWLTLQLTMHGMRPISKLLSFSILAGLRVLLWTACFLGGGMWTTLHFVNLLETCSSWLLMQESSPLLRSRGKGVTTT